MTYTPHRILEAQALYQYTTTTELFRLFKEQKYVSDKCTNIHIYLPIYVHMYIHMHIY